MAKAKRLLFCCFLISSLPGWSQPRLQQLQDSIYHYREKSINSNIDSNRLKLNDKIVGFWKEALEQEASQVFDFSRLQRFSILREREVTMVTWNLEINGFDNNFFGVVGYRENRDRKSKVLLDGGIDIKNAQNQIHSARTWPGAVYYEMVPFKRKNGFSYLLLGWRGQNRLESYKIADVFSPSKDGINFGLPILEIKKGERINRFVVHYPASLNYSMKYNEKEKQFYFNRLDVIDETKGPVFNNLTPTYTFDAFRYKGGKWIFDRDVEILKPE